MNSISRRTAALGLGAAAVVPQGRAQTSAQPPLVGMLYLGNEASYASRLAAFRDGLRSNGLVEGVSVRLAIRYADSVAERIAGLARELEAVGCGLIVTSGSISVRASKAALPTMPIVMAGSADPVLMGHAQSLARPGGRITGISILGSEIGRKRMQFLKEILPAAKHFVVLANAANPGNDALRHGVAESARSLQMEITVREVRTPEEIPAVLARSSKVPADGVYIIADAMFNQAREAIFRAALSERMPTMTPDVAYAQAGALAAYAFDSASIYRQSAHYVAAILRGAEPGDLPIEQPTKFVLAINLRTARALSIQIPQLLLLRADEIIE